MRWVYPEEQHEMQMTRSERFARDIVVGLWVGGGLIWALLIVTWIARAFR